jgi:hypothetical protein
MKTRGKIMTRIPQTKTPSRIIPIGQLKEQLQTKRNQHTPSELCKYYATCNRECSICLYSDNYNDEQLKRLELFELLEQQLLKQAQETFDKPSAFEYLLYVLAGLTTVITVMLWLLSN